MNKLHAKLGERKVKGRGGRNFERMEGKKEGEGRLERVREGGWIWVGGKL